MSKEAVEPKKIDIKYVLLTGGTTLLIDTQFGGEPLGTRAYKRAGVSVGASFVAPVILKAISGIAPPELPYPEAIATGVAFAGGVRAFGLASASFIYDFFIGAGSCVAAQVVTKQLMK